MEGGRWQEAHLALALEKEGLRGRCLLYNAFLPSFPRKINQVALRGIETYLNKTELVHEEIHLNCIFCWKASTGEISFLLSSILCFQMKEIRKCQEEYRADLYRLGWVRVQCVP